MPAGNGVPFLGDGLAVGEEDAEECDSVASDNSHQGPCCVLEFLGCEEGCVQPEDRQLAEDCAEQPSNAGYHDELVAL